VSSRTAAAIIAIVLTFLIILVVLSRWHHECPRETGALGQDVIIARVGAVGDQGEVGDPPLCFLPLRLAISGCASI
jgi:hypothetical protein